jgi:hypothetical protein
VENARLYVERWREKMGGEKEEKETKKEERERKKEG